MVKKVIKKTVAVKKTTASEKKSEESINDEPSWYHYLIVFLVILGVFGVFYYGVEIYGKTFDSNSSDKDDLRKSYIHEYVVDGKTYNLEFQHTFDEIEKFNYSIEVNKYDLLNSKNITLSFGEYNGTDNKPVAIVSVKIMRFLKYVYGVEFGENNFNTLDGVSCKNSTLEEKVMTFNPYANESGVYYNTTTGCVEIKATSPDKFVGVGDTFLYTLINAEVK